MAYVVLEFYSVCLEFVYMKHASIEDVSLILQNQYVYQCIFFFKRVI